MDPFLRGAEQARRLREHILQVGDAGQLAGRLRQPLLGLGNVGEVALHLGERAALSAGDFPGPRELLALDLEQRREVVAEWKGR